MNSAAAAGRWLYDVRADYTYVAGWAHTLTPLVPLSTRLHHALSTSYGTHLSTTPAVLCRPHAAQLGAAASE
jgi:hypothetical protein